jgi:hypothetical protein
MRLPSRKSCERLITRMKDLSAPCSSCQALVRAAVLCSTAALHPSSFSR